MNLIMLILILVKGNQYWCSYRKIPNQPNSNFWREKISASLKILKMAQKSKHCYQ